MTVLRTLDWVSKHDPRSRDYPIRELIGENVKRRYKAWGSPRERLDQGSEGACVGFGWTHELLASPARAVLGYDAHEFARNVYRGAQRIDQWPGEDYDGTSVLAGAQTVQRAGFIGGYRWSFGIDDTLDTLCAPASEGGGPVVIGIPWYDSMYQTRPGGLVEVGGSLVGGHCLVLTGYHPGIRIREEGWLKRFEVVRWRNSWGRHYGRRGDGYIRVEDLAALLDQQGEACVPVGRVRKP